MSFLAPVAVILALLAVPIVLLYMLRLRRREIQISSTMLWQMLLRDREANAPWQRLRRNLLLFLQLLILAALVIALMRPYRDVPILTSGRIALLIDASASMNATDVTPNRFEAARARALDIVSNIRPEDSVALVRVAEGAEMLENYTSDSTRLRDALNGMQPGQSPADWSAALTLAAAGAQGAEKFTIIIIGDGGIPSEIDLRAFGDVRFIGVGSSSDNTAITALATGSDPINGPQLYAQIANFGAQDTEVIFTVSLDGNLFDAKPYIVPAGGMSDVVIGDLPADFRRVEATLSRPASATVPDFLAVDDHAWTVYTPANAGRAVILSKGNPFLEQGFASLPDWRVFQGDPSRGLPGEAYELYVFDGWIPATLPEGNLFFVNPPSSADAPTPLFTAGPLLKGVNAAGRSVRADDPRTRYLKFDDVNVLQFREVQAPWADALVEIDLNADIATDTYPLLLAGEYEGRRVAILTFDLFDSDLPLKIAYPILLSNLTAWYEAPRALRGETSLRPGQTMPIQPLPTTDTIRVVRPDGVTRDFSANDGTIIFADTLTPGLYTVDLLEGGNTTQSESFAVNLFNPFEARIAPRSPATGTGDIAAAGGGEVGQQEYWGILALAALILLAAEWLVHHRRLQAPRLRPVSSNRFARR